MFLGNLDLQAVTAMKIKIVIHWKESSAWKMKKKIKAKENCLMGKESTGNVKNGTEKRK